MSTQLHVSRPFVAGDLRGIDLVARSILGDPYNVSGVRSSLRHPSEAA